MGKLIVIESSCTATLPYALEKDTMPRVGNTLEALFATQVEPDARGLYLASKNAGELSALRFWSDAQVSGVALANPELFPWTLANAPCGWLARQFRVTGPNYTYTGSAKALREALEQASEDLHSGRVMTAWVIAIDFGKKPRHNTALAAIRLSLRDQPGNARQQLNIAENGTGLLSAAAFLQQIIRDTEVL